MIELLFLTIFTIAFTLLVVFMLVNLLREHRAPSATLAWGIAIVLIPYIGIPLYLLIGGRHVKSLQQKKGRIYPDRKIRRSEFPQEIEQSPVLSATVRMLDVAELPVPTVGNSVEFFANGVKAFNRLMEMIQNAKESINITTFILGRRTVGKIIIAELAKKAAEGVSVRLLLDGFGAMRSNPWFVRPLKKAGGKIGIFSPMWIPRLSHSTHLRNHRKITIVDGKTAMVGGMNLAEEYMGPRPSYKRWADTGVIIEGPAVEDFLRIFGADWEYATREKLPIHHNTDEQPSGNAIVQVVASGPDSEALSLHDAFATAMMTSKKRVWIVTPYFIPDETLMRLLQMLGRLGRDVRIVVPQKSNHHIADLARGAFFRQLIHSDIKLYGYKPGMLHAKLMIIDDTIAMVGSANLDVRSLYLDYEAGAFIYSQKHIRLIEDVIEGYIERSEKYTEEKGIYKGFSQELTEDICRLFTPLL